MSRMEAGDEEVLRKSQNPGSCTCDEKSPGNSYTILMPSPNVTGHMHIGHGLNLTVQDLFARWYKVAGYDVLWAPGLDHGGIATQHLVEKKLKHDKNKVRFDIGKKNFLQEMYSWTEEKKYIIFEEMKRLGLDLPWEESWFSKDKKIEDVVSRGFVELHRQGLIYREKGIVNWCPVCSTALSDIEINIGELETNRYLIKAAICSSDEFLEITSVRPELMLGCSAVGITKNDEQNSKYIGKEITLPLLARKVPVVAIEKSQAGYGNGISMVCPGNSPRDYEISKSNGLELIEAFGKDGKAKPAFTYFAGKDMQDCRELMVKLLTDEDVLRQESKVIYGKAHCYRCSSPVVPMLSSQWYLKTSLLAKDAIENVKSGAMKFNDAVWRDRYIVWLETLLQENGERTRESWWEGACLAVAMGYSTNSDWVISRQIWWGNRIPAWHCSECGQVTVDLKKPRKCENCSSINLDEDSDVLDVWFSNTLWPLTPVGQPSGSKARQWRNTAPVDLTVIGHDILYFWITGTNMVCTKLTGRPAFRNVYVHGLIADEQGHKMTKSLGNTIGLSETLEEYGIDVFRDALLRLLPGKDGEEYLRLGKYNFEESYKRVKALSDYLSLSVSRKDFYCDSGKSSICKDIEAARNEIGRAFDAMNLSLALSKVDRLLQEIMDSNPDGVDRVTFPQFVEILSPFYPVTTQQFHPVCIKQGE